MHKSMYLTLHTEGGRLGECCSLSNRFIEFWDSHQRIIETLLDFTRNYLLEPDGDGVVFIL